MATGNEIYSYLKFRISAEDLTGTVWGRVAGSMVDAANTSKKITSVWDGFKHTIGTIVDPISRIVGTLKTGADYALRFADSVKEGLIAGGRYNEVATAFEKAAAAAGTSPNSYLKALDRVAEGEKTLTELSEMANRSLRMGFSASQTEEVYRFAKAYTDAVGGSFEEVGSTIEMALSKGKRLESLNVFGLHIQKGMQMSEVMKQLQEGTQKLTADAFNFGDVWTEVWTKGKDVGVLFFREINRLMGEDGGVEDFAQRVREAFWSIQEWMPAIAKGIWVPVQDMFKAVFGDIELSAKTLGLQLAKIVYEIANKYYEVRRALPWNYFGEGYDKVIEKQKAFNASMDEVFASLKSQKSVLSDTATGLTTVGTATEITTRKTRGQAEAVHQLTKKEKEREEAMKAAQSRAEGWYKTQAKYGGSTTWLPNGVQDFGRTDDKGNAVNKDRTGWNKDSNFRLPDRMPTPVKQEIVFRTTGSGPMKYLVDWLITELNRMAVAEGRQVAGL